MIILPPKPERLEKKTDVVISIICIYGTAETLVSRFSKHFLLFKKVQIYNKIKKGITGKYFNYLKQLLCWENHARFKDAV